VVVLVMGVSLAEVPLGKMDRSAGLAIRSRMGRAEVTPRSATSPSTPASGQPPPAEPVAPPTSGQPD
jgi:hypothetical protein